MFIYEQWILYELPCLLLHKNPGSAFWMHHHGLDFDDDVLVNFGKHQQIFVYDGGIQFVYMSPKFHNLYRRVKH